MAPELFLGARYDTRAADVWALGVLLHEMLTGQEPFKGMHPMQVARAVVETRLDAESCETQYALPPIESS